jgi:hypothetical protein
MEAQTATDPLQEVILARRARALDAMRKFRPMSVWGQLVVLLFMAAMTFLMSAVGMLRSVPDRTALPLLVAIFFVAGNAIRTQRQVQALVELVSRDLEEA